MVPEVKMTRQVSLERGLYRRPLPPMSRAEQQSARERRLARSLLGRSFERVSRSPRGLSLKRSATTMAAKFAAVSSFMPWRTEFRDGRR